MFFLAASPAKLQKFNDVELFGSTTLAVTVDAGGSTFGMPPVDLSVEDYDGALTVGTSASFASAVAQVDTFTIITGGSTSSLMGYEVNINSSRFHVAIGTEIGPSDTATQIAAALVTKINAGTDEGVTATSTGDTITLTTDVAGKGFISFGASDLPSPSDVQVNGTLTENAAIRATWLRFTPSSVGSSTPALIETAIHYAHHRPCQRTHRR